MRNIDFIKPCLPRSDFSSFLGPLFFTWVILQLFLVILTSLVYEKEQKLRIMMKMHGLGDGPYWTISYAYFLVISSAYMICFVIFGSVIGLKYFILNDYNIQLVFHFLYIKLQISLAFLLASIFSNVKTAAGYILVFGSGLLGGFLFEFFVQDTSFPRRRIIVMELYPGFSLHCGLYECAQYAITGNSKGTDGMRWSNLSDSSNGMKEVLIIMFVEWLVVLFIAYYIDQPNRNLNRIVREKEKGGMDHPKVPRARQDYKGRDLSFHLSISSFLLHFSIYLYCRGI
ncbi:hypothetical protein NMG60_11033680 [Bertholletia excelsa]